MKNLKRWWVVFAMLMTVAGCDFGSGPDSISSHGAYSRGAAVSCACHMSPMGMRRQIMGAGGDFASNPTVTSHHVAGGSDPTKDQCLVCHDISTHGLGMVRLRNADTGSVISYSTPSTLEPFCLSCHDSDGALVTNLSGTGFNPFNDGRTFGVIPHEAGNKIASYWTDSYTVHKTNGLTCAGTGALGTGCHGRNGTINMHGSTAKGLLTNTMNFQIPLESYSVYSAGRPSFSSYNYDNYKLCFDCHQNYPNVTKEVVLGYKQDGVFDILWAPSPYSASTTSILSLFRDMYSSSTGSYPAYWGGVNQPYNDSILLMYPYLALHNYHLLGFGPDLYGPDPESNLLSWKYRGDPAQTGRITCTACHNVHGTTNPIRSTNSELVITSHTGTGPDLYRQLYEDPSYWLFVDSIMTSYPINCVSTCHGPKETSSYWYSPLPSGE